MAEAKCKKCGGTGMARREKCPTCKGSGLVNITTVDGKSTITPAVCK